MGISFKFDVCKQKFPLSLSHNIHACETEKETSNKYTKANHNKAMCDANHRRIKTLNLKNHCFREQHTTKFSDLGRATDGDGFRYECEVYIQTHTHMDQGTGYYEYTKQTTNINM